MVAAVRASARPARWASRPIPRAAGPRPAAYLDHHVREHAVRHGWGKTIRNRILQGVRVLLGIQDTPGALIKASDVLLPRDVHLPAEPTLTVLAAAGVLDDDRTPALKSRFARQIAGLPAPMHAELTLWYEVLTFGSTTPPWMRSKAPVTIRTRVMWAMPALRTWADAGGYQSLRRSPRPMSKRFCPRWYSARHDG